jgi:hypothetical protein
LMSASVRWVWGMPVSFSTVAVTSLLLSSSTASEMVSLPSCQGMVCGWGWGLAGSRGEGCACARVCACGGADHAPGRRRSRGARVAPPSARGRNDGTGAPGCARSKGRCKKSKGAPLTPSPSYLDHASSAVSTVFLAVSIEKLAASPTAPFTPSTSSFLIASAACGWGFWFRGLGFGSRVGSLPRLGCGLTFELCRGCAVRSRSPPPAGPCACGWEARAATLGRAVR